MTITESFGSLPQVKQVMVYAEARVEQKYELLAVLKHLIPFKGKQLFLKLVDDYIVGKYGRNYL
jgi:hypothetical protein